MQIWIERLLKQAMEDYAEEQESQKVKEAATLNFVERLDSLKDDPDAFFKMGGILGRPSGSFSWEELREEAMLEKYGVWRKHPC